jgi:hypothetical protein
MNTKNSNPCLTVFELVDRVTGNSIPYEVTVPDVDALELLAQHVYRYNSRAFNARSAGMTRAEAKRVAAILIRTRLLPTLNGGAVARAFEIAKAGQEVQAV